MNLRVLIADDDPVARLALRSTLEEAGYAVAEAADGRMALEGLAVDDPPRLAILDWEMPVTSGLEVCQRLRATKGAPHVHVMMLTTKGGLRDRIEAFDAGADDYLTKPFQPRELITKLARARRVLRMVEALQAERAMVRGHIAMDLRVGLLGPGEMHRVLERELARGRRVDDVFSAFIAEVPLAQEKGRDAEGTLRRVAGAMRGSMRSYDCIGRERRGRLLVVLPGCDGPRATTVAERHLAAIAAATPAAVRIGVATQRLDVIQDATELLLEADLALTRARQPGSARVRFAGEVRPD